MREVAAEVPFKWEEAPGKAAAAHHSITAESGELQDASRRTGTSGAAQEQLREVEAKDSEAAPRDPEANQETKISGTDHDRDHASGSSFRSSRRYYSRMSSRISDRSMSFGASSSCNSDQLADLTHQLAVPHIDLVAPAAARFLAESAKTNTVLDSPIATPPGKHVLSVPFKWEEAPGKPKVDDSTVAAAAGAPDLQRETSTTPASLQLPPALLATLHMKLGAANTSRSTAAEIRSRYSRLPHSGPLELQRWRSDLHVPSCKSSSCSLQQEAAKRQSLSRRSLQNPCRSTAFCTLSGPILRSSPHDHESCSLDQLSDVDSAENSCRYHHQEQHAGHGLLSAGKNNPAAWSPTSILCGPCTCQDQRPITSMLMSLVSDVEAVQHSSSLATASSISNSTSQYSSSTSQESFEHSCSSATEQIANSTASSLKTFLKKCRLVKSHESLNSKSQRCITNAPAGFDSHQLDLQLSMSPELPWQCPPMDPCVQSLDLNEDTLAASEITNMQQLKLHDHQEFPVTISLSPANYHTHDAEFCPKLEAARPGYHHQPVYAQLPYPVPDSAEQEQMVQEEYTADDEQADFFGCLGFPFLPVRRMAKATTGNGMDPSLYVNNPSDSCAEDGYRSPAYTATLELLSPSADLMARRQGSGLRMRSLKHPRSLLESMCNSFKHTLLSCAISGSHRTSPVLRQDGHFLATSGLQAS